MKIANKDIRDITSKNVKSYISGNINYYLSKVINMPLHLKEQYYHRLNTCKDTCLVERKCRICNCPVKKVAYSSESCNKDLFPDFLSGREWDKYKIKNNIVIDKELIEEIEYEIQQKGV